MLFPYLCRPEKRKGLVVKLIKKLPCHPSESVGTDSKKRYKFKILGW